MKMGVGQIIEIVYLDKAGKISQRKIKIKDIRDGMIRATCLTTDAPRVFRIHNILAWQPAKNQRAG
ncbi:hypothetical protein PaeBR_08330 [Paenibacillus sp. BR2-3]|uniref:hypothetical protein n=1 Tax=Paenibacillus sp. BR2-3 TaxID=3048494 RepID=UPI003977AB20